MQIVSHFSHQGNKDWLKWESWDSYFYNAEWDPLTLKRLTGEKGFVRVKPECVVCSVLFIWCQSQRARLDWCISTTWLSHFWPVLHMNYELFTKFLRAVLTKIRARMWYCVSCQAYWPVKQPTVALGPRLCTRGCHWPPVGSRWSRSWRPGCKETHRLQRQHEHTINNNPPPGLTRNV